MPAHPPPPAPASPDTGTAGAASIPVPAPGDPGPFAGRAPNRQVTLLTLLATCVIAAILHFGQDVFLPLAFATLIAFALSPMVDFLRRRGWPTILSVIAAVFCAFAAIGLFLLAVTLQLGNLAQQLPTFQGNIIAKLAEIQQSGSGDGLAARLAQMGAEISERAGAALAPAEPGERAPMQVEVIERQSPWLVLRDVMVPLLRPVATAGLVVVVVIFMLLERDELRDRFIRLAGSNDLHKTTQVISEAATRVGQYLLTLLLVNTIYAVPIGLGLWLIGVPNAVLWGLLTLVLRFIPYLGTFLSMLFPLVVAFAVSPGWSTVLWTAALFLAVELVTSNFIEPWLYSSRTGVSPLSVILSAIFWTWIWGPMGLVLATPLTVCLVVLGRHLPQFEMFDILFGDRPVLDAHSRLYQRLLAGDVSEAVMRATEDLQEDWVADYHRETALPALMLAQADHERGVVLPEEGARLSAATRRFLDEIEPLVLEEREETIENEGAITRHIVTIGGRSPLDDAAARMLAQAISADGAMVTALAHADLAPGRFAVLVAAAPDCVILGYLDRVPARATLLHVRRIKRALPAARVGVVLWSQGPQDAALLAETRREVLSIGADFCVETLDEAMAEAISEAAPRDISDLPRRPRAARRLRTVPARAAG